MTVVGPDRKLVADIVEVMPRADVTMSAAPRFAPACPQGTKIQGALTLE
jgi:hypothetical protein